MSRKKELAKQQAPKYVRKSVILHPVADLSLGQAQNILGGIGRGLTTANVQEVQAAGSLVQAFLITGGITIEAADIFLDQGSGLGIVFLLADDLLHQIDLLSK